MNKNSYLMVQGELYEIQGILYLILSYQVYTNWASWLLFVYGIITIAVGGYKSYNGRLKDRDL